MRRWLKTAAWAALLLITAIVAAAAWYAQRALPQTDGLLTLSGAAAELRIERDEHGIPTVRAGSPHDAYFGLGVAHAQDRLWQMETHRRIGAGRLAEVFGASALETDRFLRALGVRRTAAAQWQLLDVESRAALQAYADGVNAVLRQALRARPPEFVILGIEPEPWDPVDSLAWAIMMAWDLGANWNTELLRLRLALQMPVARINELLPAYPGEALPRTADYAALFRGLKLDAGAVQTAWQRLPEIAPPSGVEGVGSNNWVVAGSHTTTGAPLLANDPHLKLSSPALWYFARLEAPGLKVAGATLPGLPVVVLGQNEQIAWGATNTAPDVQDLYVEQIKPDDPSMYRTPEGWAAFETSAEVIKVKGQPGVPFTHRRTRHGPVISDAGTTADVLGPRDRPAYVLALRWTALDADAALLSASLAMQRAGSVQSFFDATRGWSAPMQNLVVADRAGRIGVVSPGRVPVRQPGNDLQGLVPAPGWEARYDWAGWVPADETPRETDPARGPPPPPTSGSRRRAIRTTSPANGRCPTGSSASSNCCVRGASIRSTTWRRCRPTNNRWPRRRCCPGCRRRRRRMRWRRRHRCSCRSSTARWLPTARRRSSSGPGSANSRAASSRTTPAPNCGKSRWPRALSRTRWRTCSSATTPPGATTAARRRRKPVPCRATLR